VSGVLPIQTEPGFTSSEVLIASTLVGPVLICAFIILETMHGAYSRGERRADLQQSARIGMARIVRELRAAGLDPSGLIPGLPNPGPIQTADISRIAFIGDANGDGSSKKVEYRLDLSASPPVLRRQQWSTWGGGWSGTNGAQPLAEGITAVEFTYFGAGGSAIPPDELAARLGEIRRVGISITALAPPGHILSEPFRLVSEVQLRNRGL
jgi:type II secretory pathway component PulJ